MFWVISHCYEVIFHLWQSLSERGEPVREGPELSVSRSDLSTFSVIHFLLWSRAREPSNLCPGTGMTRRQSLLWLITRINISRSRLAVLTPGSWQLLTQFPVILTALTPGADRGPVRGPTLCFIGILSGERDLQTSVKWQWVSEKGQLSCTLPRSEIITFSLTTSKMSLVNYVFCFYWPGGILSTVPKNCFLENKIKLSGII